MKERLKAALETLQEIVEELQSQENEFAAKKSDWYEKNLRLNYSGLMDDAEFGTKVWNVMHEDLSSSFHSDISTMKWAMNGFLGHFEEFEKVRKRLDDLVADETDRVPEGWNAYKVSYNEKCCAVEQDFYCYAPSVEKAMEFCKRVNGSDVLSINKVEEDRL